MDALWVLFRVIISLSFLMAGLVKAKEMSLFEEAIKAYNLVPSVFVKPISRILPVVEILLGIVIGLNLWTNISLALAAMFLLLFAIAITINLLRHKNHKCGCFGNPNQTINWWMVVRNVFLCLLSIIYLI